MTWEVIQGDCLEVMRGLPPASIDACITDPPYGTTACAWDSVIPFAPMWAELKRIVKPKGAIVLFGSQPFTSALVMSNPTMFKHEWVWDKVNKNTNFLNAKRSPLRRHEDVVVFGQEVVVYNRQMRPCEPYVTRRTQADGRWQQWGAATGKDAGRFVTEIAPASIVEFPSHVTTETFHPSQKPIELLCYLVRTYSNAGDTVLDFTCGSGTTGVACEIEGRSSINIDSDGHYCEVARARMTRAQGVGVDIPRRVKEYPPAPLFEAVSIQREDDLRIAV